MVTRVNSSVPAVVTHSRSYVTPIIAALAFAALACLVFRVASSLMGRVQAITDPNDLHAQGQEDFKNKNYQEAIVKYSLALKHNPDKELRANIFCDRGAAYRQKGDLDIALRNYQAALKFTAETDFLAMVHMCIAEVHAEKNEHELAVQEYTEALELEHSDEGMKPILLQKRARSQLIMISDPKQWFEMGSADFKEFKYAKAIEKFTLALQCNPNDMVRTDILADRAYAYCQIGKLDESLADFRAALTFTTNTDFLIMIYRYIGDVYRQKNEHSLAVQAYTNGLESEHSDRKIKPILLLKRAGAQSVLNNHEKAFEDFTAALACKFEDKNLLAEILATRAAMYLKMDLIELARQDFTDADICDFDDMELRRFIYVERGGIYSSMGEHNLARADYDRALESKGYDGYVFAKIAYRRGSSYLALGRLDDAFQDFEDANKCQFTDPNLRASILGARSKVYFEQKNIGLALKDLTDAIKCEPTESLDDYLVRRAMILMNLKRCSESIEDFTKSMEVHPLPTESRAEILYCRGIAHRENNNLEQARRDWATALKCKISQKLRDAINAELNPKDASIVSKTGAVLGWVTSKWTGNSKK